MDIQSRLHCELWMLMCGIWEIVVSVQILELSDIYKPKYFCGNALSDAMDAACAVHNVRNSQYGPRIKRQIVEECCRQPCTMNYMMKNYCLVPESIFKILQSTTTSYENKPSTKKGELPKKSDFSEERLTQKPGSHYSEHVRKPFARRRKPKGRWDKVGRNGKCRCWRRNEKKKFSQHGRRIVNMLSAYNSHAPRLTDVPSTMSPVLSPYGMWLAVPEAHYIVHEET